MATTVISLLDKLRGWIGDEDTTNQLYTDANLRDIKFPIGLDVLNDRGWPQRYEISGSGDSATFNPDPSDSSRADINAILIATAIAVTEGEIQKYARSAFVTSNPAGRTDLTRISEALLNRKKTLEDRLEDAYLHRGKQAADGDMSSSELSNSAAEESPEGLPIITIIRENR